LMSALMLGVVLSLVMPVAVMWLLFRLNPSCLKHVQVFQVLRAQTILPYTVQKEADGNEVVRPVYTNQLGNNLFQYVYARLHAELSGAEFSAGLLNQEVFMAKGQKNVGNDNPFAKAAPFDKLEQFSPRSESPHPRKGESEKAALQRKFSEKFLRQRPDNFAQDISLYDGYLSQIRDWLEPSVESHTKEIEAAMEMGVQDMDTAVIHLRFAAAHEGILSADPTYHTLPTQFYAKSLRRIEELNGRPLRKIVVVHGPCCDREVAEVRAELEKDWGDAEFVMQSAGRCEDFIAMYAARNLVISVSTFAWWAGFLGRGEFEKRVFYPYHAQVPLLHPARMRRWFNRLLPTCESESRFHAVEYTSRRPSLLRKQLGGLMRPVRSVGNLQRMAAKASPKAGMPRSKSHQHLAGR